MKKYLFLIFILFLSGCSSALRDDRLRVMDELDEKRIQDQFVLPESKESLRFSVSILGLTNYEVYSENDIHEKFPEKTLEFKTISLGESAATLEDERPLYFYGEDHAKHMTYKYALKKEVIEKMKKQFAGNELIIAWIDDEHEALYECEKEHNYQYTNRCSYGGFDNKKNKGGKSSFYTTSYDEDIDQKSIALRRKVESERNKRYENWKQIHRGKGIVNFLEEESEMPYAFLPSEYHYYCSKRQDHFYHCKVKFNLNILIAN